MAKYTVESPEGKRITFQWDDPNPPTDADMEEVFAAAGGGTSPAPAVPAAPAKPSTLGDKVTEGLRYLIPSRVEYGEKHPGKNTIKGQVMGEGADPSYLGQVGAYAEDATSLPRRMWGAGWNLAKGDLAGAKREMQKTEGETFLETVGRELPTMMTPGGQARTAGKMLGSTAKALEGAPKAVQAAEGALPLKPWIAEAVEAIPAKAAAAVEAVPKMGQKVLGGLKRMGGDLMARMGRSAAETAPQAAYHQLQAHQDTGEGAGAQGAVELGAGAGFGAAGKVLGGTAKMVPQGAKWLMSQFSGANQKALQRASQAGGVDALKKVSSDAAADDLADELITSLGRKEELLHPEPKLAAEIIPKLPDVQAVEPMTRRNTVAMSGGKEIPMEFNRPLEPMRTGSNRPSLKDQAELEKLGPMPGEGLPGGNEKYEAAARRFRTEGAERTQQAAITTQTVKQALRGIGQKIYVSDAMRSQLGLSGSRWKSGASDFGLDMLTSDKSKGVGLDRAAMIIGEQQAAGKWAGLPKIENQDDLMDVLYDSGIQKARAGSDLQKFLEESIKTGQHMQGAETALAGDLQRGDIFTVGGSLFKVTKAEGGQVIVDGPVKHILDAKQKVHFDAGSRLGNGGETFSPQGVAESMMEIPEQGKVDFIKTLTYGREKFRDILEKKVGETVRTPEKEKTLGKLRRLLDLADEQLQGAETLSAKEAESFKRDYQDVLREQYKSRDSDEYFSTYKSLARSLRTGIEDAAEKSKNPEYITIMRNLANKLQVIDRVESRFVGDQITKAQDRAARQIKIITNDAQRPALRELEVLDKLFGSNFAERAKDIGYAKMLNMGAEGVPLLPVHFTGKALMGASTVGGMYSARDGEPNPMALVGLMLSSPRMAVYAFKALDNAAIVAPRVGKTLGPALPRMTSTAIDYNRDKERSP